MATMTTIRIVLRSLSQSRQVVLSSLRRLQQLSKVARVFKGDIRPSI